MNLASDNVEAELFYTDPGLRESTKQLFAKLGERIPSRIENAAFAIPKDEVMEMMNERLRPVHQDVIDQLPDGPLRLVSFPLEKTRTHPCQTLLEDRLRESDSALGPGEPLYGMPLPTMVPLRGRPYRLEHDQAGHHVLKLVTHDIIDPIYCEEN